MKSNFLQPCFKGARFNEHTLPLELARDLAAYETLVVELAKHLYLTDHPDRQRVPRGFEKEFSLHIERLEEGSTRPLLSVVLAGSSMLFSNSDPHFDMARDLIVECIGAKDGTLPERFPKRLLTFFNQIGRSLRDDESIEFPSGNSVSVLTPERSKNLVLAASKVYDRPIELSGSIVEVNWEKCSFQLRLTSGELATVPMADYFHNEARNCGGKDRYLVTVVGVGAFDSWDNLQKVISVDTSEVQPDYQLALRLDEIRSLKDGWHNKSGVAPNFEALERIGKNLFGKFPDFLPYPAIVPTPEGNLLFEWHLDGEPSVDVKIPSLTAEFHAFNSKHGDIEREFDLSKDDNWPDFFDFLKNNIDPIN